MLRQGDTGPEVLLWQNILRKVGFELVPDSIFGQSTKTATMDYQSLLQVARDGIVGPVTISAHNKLHPELAIQTGERELPEQKVTGTPPNSNTTKYIVLAAVGAFLAYAYFSE